MTFADPFPQIQSREVPPFLIKKTFCFMLLSMNIVFWIDSSYNLRPPNSIPSNSGQFLFADVSEAAFDTTPRLGVRAIYFDARIVAAHFGQQVEQGGF